MKNSVFELYTFGPTNFSIAINDYSENKVANF